jgi:hypothetical protein
MIKLRRIRCAGHVARKGDRRGAYRVLVGRPKEQKTLGRPRCRWEYCVEKNLQEVCSGNELV